MAILVNMGKRGFILKEGFLNPGDQITVDAETAVKLTKAYPNELRQIVVDAAEVKKVVESVKETEVAPAKSEEIEPAEDVKPKKTYRRKKGSK